MNLGLINSAWLRSPVGTAEGIRKTKRALCEGKVHGDLPPGRGVVDFLP